MSLLNFHHSIVCVLYQLELMLEVLVGALQLGEKGNKFHFFFCNLSYWLKLPVTPGASLLCNGGVWANSVLNQSLSFHLFVAVFCDNSSCRMDVMEFGIVIVFSSWLWLVSEFPYQQCVASNFSQEWERGTQGEGGRERGREELGREGGRER